MAMAIFGKAGMKMLPMLSDGAEGIRRVKEEARRLGITMSKEDAEAAEALGDKIGALGTQFKYLLFNIGAAVAPLASIDHQHRRATARSATRDFHFGARNSCRCDGRVS